MEIENRKMKIIQAIIQTRNENILDLLEEDLNITYSSEIFDTENNLEPGDFKELKDSIAENFEENTISENEFWTLINS